MKFIYIYLFQLFVLNVPGTMRCCFWGMASPCVLLLKPSHGRQTRNKARPRAFFCQGIPMGLRNSQNHGDSWCICCLGEMICLVCVRERLYMQWLVTSVPKETSSRILGGAIGYKYSYIFLPFPTPTTLDRHRLIDCTNPTSIVPVYNIPMYPPCCWCINIV